MKPEEQDLLEELLTGNRVLSLGVMVDGRPHVVLLPFVVADDRQSALVHASQLARHSRGLQPGTPFSILIHAADHPEVDPLQITRVSISGTVQHVAHSDADYAISRESFIDRFPSSELTFTLGDFNLYRLHFERGRLVSGFARAIILGPESFEELASDR